MLIFSINLVSIFVNFAWSGILISDKFDNIIYTKRANYYYDIKSTELLYFLKYFLLAVDKYIL